MLVGGTAMGVGGTLLAIPLAADPHTTGKTVPEAMPWASVSSSSMAEIVSPSRYRSISPSSATTIPSTRASRIAVSRALWRSGRFKTTLSRSTDLLSSTGGAGSGRLARRAWPSRHARKAAPPSKLV